MATRDALILRADELADGVGSQDWTLTYKLSHLGLVHWREWADLLNASPDLRINRRTVTLDANGRFAVSALNSGSADSLRTAYRVRAVLDDAHVYPLVQHIDYVRGSEQEIERPVGYYFVGDEVQLLGGTAGQTLTVVCNDRPQRADRLTAGTAEVVFPDGYEDLLAYGLAARMLTKGGRETGAAADLLALASEMRNDMLLDLRRRSTVPMRARFHDDASDWGG